MSNRRKNQYRIFACLSILCFLLFSCPFGGIKVIFDSDGGTNTGYIQLRPLELTVKKLPAEPIKEGYIFKGWFAERCGRGAEFTVDTPVTNSIIVYAKWAAYNAIENVIIDPQDRKLTVYWDDPQRDGFSNIIISVIQSDGSLINELDVDRGVEKVEITGLTNGQEYSLIFKALANQKDAFYGISIKAIPNLYTIVSYENLWNYLSKTASDSNTNYIKITGFDLQGMNQIGDSLAIILKANPTKKVFIYLPNRIEGLEYMNSFFNGCTSLVGVVNIPIGVTYMSECFYGCTSLTSAPTIPNSVIDMSGCFYGCTALTSAQTIPNSVIDLSWCFSGCTSLITVSTISSNATKVMGCFDRCTSLSSVPSIPNSVIDMSWCFSGCTSLITAPTIPYGVNDMSYCFHGCTSLIAALAIPNSVTNMLECFYNCTSLTTAPVIPNSVHFMRNCFENCVSLNSITLLCNYAQGRHDYTFRGCNAIADGGIKVSPSQLTTYQDFSATMGTTTVKFSAIE